MIVLTQVIYLKPGQEKIFDEFEAIAIPGIARYGGQLLMRLRPSAVQWIEGSMKPPYEIHLVSFNHEAELNAFLQDEERRRYLHLKEKAIESSIIYKGSPYP